MFKSSIAILVATPVPLYMHALITFVIAVLFDVIVPRISDYQSRCISPHSKVPIYQTDTFESRRARSRKSNENDDKKIGPQS